MLEGAGGQERRPSIFVFVDVIAVLLGEADVIKAHFEPPYHIGIDLEADNHAGCGDRLAGQIAELKGGNRARNGVIQSGGWNIVIFHSEGEPRAADFAPCNV